MKLVVVKVELEDKMEYPAASPDPGEHIVVKVVELAKLKSVLQSACFSGSCVSLRMMYSASKTTTKRYARCSVPRTCVQRTTRVSL